MPPASTPSVSSGRSCGFATCRTVPPSVSSTTIPFGPASAGRSAKLNASVAPAYHVRFETFWKTW